MSEPANPPFAGLHARQIPPTEALRYGALGATAWRAMRNKPGQILNTQSAPSIGSISSVEEAKRIFVVPRNPSTKTIWQIVPPVATGSHVVSAYKVQFWRLSVMTSGQDGIITGLVLIRDAEDSVTISSDGPTLTYEQDHYQGDLCIALVTEITLGTGSLPFPANLGFTVMYKFL